MSRGRRVPQLSAGGRDLLEEQINHEQEHAAAARAVGFTRIGYGLAHRAVPGDGGTPTLEWQLFTQFAAPSRPVTKLAVAAIAAAPAWTREEIRSRGMLLPDLPSGFGLGEDDAGWLSDPQSAALSATRARFMKSHRVLDCLVRAGY